MVVVFGTLGLAISVTCITVLTNGFDASFCWLARRSMRLRFLGKEGQVRSPPEKEWNDRLKRVWRPNGLRVGGGAQNQNIGRGAWGKSPSFCVGRVGKLHRAGALNPLTLTAPPL